MRLSDLLVMIPVLLAGCASVEARSDSGPAEGLDCGAPERTDAGTADAGSSLDAGSRGDRDAGSDPVADSGADAGVGTADSGLAAPCSASSTCGGGRDLGRLTEADCFRACLAEEAGQSCTWGSTELFPSTVDVCQVVGGCGEDATAPSSLERCECAALCDTFPERPMRQCTWGTEVLRARQRETCSATSTLCSGGATNIETRGRCECEGLCSRLALSDPSMQCTWGTEVLRDTSSRLCAVVGCSGRVQWSSNLGRCDCERECTSRRMGSARCDWDGVTFVDHPRALCAITGQPSFTTTECACSGLCSGVRRGNPGAACLWGGSPL